MASAVLSWAGKGFVTGASSKAGEMAFQHVAAALGIQDPTQQVRDELRAINTKLDALSVDLGIIKARISALAYQLELAELKLYQRIEEKAIPPAIDRIVTHFTGYPAPALLRGESLSDPLPAVTSLSQLLERKIEGLLTKEATDLFMGNLLGFWDIATDINDIYYALVGVSVSGDDGILRALTDLFIAQMGTGAMDTRLFHFYEILEQRFMSLITIQLQGVYLVAMAKSRGAPTEADKYLRKDFVANVLRDEIDLFLWCTEKLVLSQGQWRSPSPNANNAMKEVRTRPVLVGGMGVPTDLAKTLLRAELIGRRLLETFRDMRDFPDPDKRHLGEMDALARTDGIYVHLLCPEEDIAKVPCSKNDVLNLICTKEGDAHERDGGPELKPWPNGANKGRSLPATGAYVPVWGGSKEGHAQLKRLDKSRLRLVRYFWPWYQIRGPAEANFVNGKPFNQILLPETEFLKMGIDWRVHAGHAVETARLRPPVMTDAEARAAAWTISPLAGVDKHTAGQLTTEGMNRPLLIPETAKAFYRAGFTLQGKQTFDASGRNPYSVVATMSCPLFWYQDDADRKLKLHLWMSLLMSRNLTNCLNFRMGTRVMVKLKTPQGDRELYDSNNSSGDGQPYLWNEGRQSGQPPQARDEPVLTFTVDVGKTSEMEKYSLVVTAEVLHQGHCPGAIADVQASIKELSISWIRDSGKEGNATDRQS